MEVADAAVDVVDIAERELVTETAVAELNGLVVEVVDAREDVGATVEITGVVEMTVEDVPVTTEAAFEDALWDADVEASVVIDIALEGADDAVGDAA